MSWLQQNVLQKSVNSKCVTRDAMYSFIAKQIINDPFITHSLYRRHFDLNSFIIVDLQCPPKVLEQ